MLSENLECFFALIKYQNYKKAADSLFISQPTLSRRIWDLEAEVGTTLFIRNTRPIKLTEAGNLFYVSVQKIYDEYCDLLHTMQTPLLNSEPTLSLGYMGIYDHFFLVNALDKFSKTYPSVYVKIKKITAPKSIQEIKNGSLDAAFVISQSVDKIPESGISYLKVANNKVKLMVPSNHPLATKEKISFRELEGIDMVSLTNDYSPYLSSNLLYFSTEYGFEPNIKYYADDYQDLQMMVSLGYGVSLIGELSIKDISSNPNIKVINLEENNMDTDLLLVYLIKSSIVQAFISCVNDTSSPDNS